MNAEDGIWLFRELTIAHRIPSVVEWNGRRHTVSVPLYALRATTKNYSITRLPDMRDLNAEEEGIVIRLGQRAGHIVEYDNPKGIMLVW